MFSSIVGDTLRTLNVPPDMPVKQLVVSDDLAKAAGTAAGNAAGKGAAPASVRSLTVSADAHAHAGVVR